MSQAVSGTPEKSGVDVVGEGDGSARSAEVATDAGLRSDWQALIEARKELLKCMASMEKAQIQEREENARLLEAIEKAQALYHEENQQAQLAMGRCVVNTVVAEWEGNETTYALYRQESEKARLAMDKRMAEAMMTTWEESRQVQARYFEQNQKVMLSMDRRILEGLSIHREAVAVYREAMGKAVAEVRAEIGAVGHQLWLACGALLVVFLLQTWY
ncbi:MAG: hypothetical protein OXC07_00500 [Kistimonas sp.]|nr:hypothetical protein [Kistimonas sp.]